MIFCVGQEPHRVSAFHSWAVDHNVSVCPLIGSYRGVTEQSFAVRAADFSKVAPWTRAEESILHLGLTDRSGARPARLIFADSRIEELGRFIACSRETALALSSWTFDPANGGYFMCAADVGNVHLGVAN